MKDWYPSEIVLSSRIFLFLKTDRSSSASDFCFQYNEPCCFLLSFTYLSDVISQCKIFATVADNWELQLKSNLFRHSDFWGMERQINVAVCMSIYIRVVIISVSVLDRVQSFLPQMAHANDELRRKMVTAPAHQFDIENLSSATEKVIEMVNTMFLVLRTPLRYV